MSKDKSILSVLAMIFAAPFVIAYSAFAITLVWDWLIISSFANLPNLSVPFIIGLSLLKTSLIGFSKDKEDKAASDRIIEGFMYPTLFIFVAWCAKQFI